MTATAEATTIRATLNGAVAELGPDVLDALRDAARATKTAWGTCNHCKRRVEVEIQDAQAAIAASKAIMDYTEGKPAALAEDQGETLTIERGIQAPLNPADLLDQLRNGHLDDLEATLLQAANAQRED